MNRVFETEDADAVIAFETVPPDEVVHYGIASVRRSGEEFFELEGLVEKPPADEAPSCLAVAARYVFQPVIFEHLERTGAGQGKRDPIDRRDQQPDSQRGPRPGSSSGGRGAALRHRQLPQLFSGLFRVCDRGPPVRPGTPRIRATSGWRAETNEYADYPAANVCPSRV